MEVRKLISNAQKAAFPVAVACLGGKAKIQVRAFLLVASYTD
jgi:hypothetical protein